MDLNAACNGAGDLDLLFDRAQSGLVTRMLYDLDFKRAESNIDRQYPGLEDYFGFDFESECMVHLQVHYQMVTGQPLIKNYRFSIEDQVLDNLILHENTNVPVPAPTLEAAVHLFRGLIKLGWTFSLRPTQLRAHLAKVREELVYLLPAGSENLDESLFKKTFPGLDFDLFCVLVDSIQSEVTLIDWYKIRVKLLPFLDQYKRRGQIAEHSAWLVRRFYLFLYMKTFGKAPLRMPATGGVGIAVVGSDGAGKSTNLKELESWLGRFFKTSRVHMGRPKPGIGTRVFSRLTRIVERLGNGKYSIPQPGKPDVNQWPGYLAWIPANLYLALARDRWRTYLKIKHRTGAGQVVLCDRFPMQGIKLMDSPRINKVADTGSGIYNWLAKKEAAIYECFEQLDLTVLLVLDPEMAAQRQPGDGREYVLARAGEVQRFAEVVGDETLVVDASQPLETVVEQVRHLVWSRI